MKKQKEIIALLQDLALDVILVSDPYNMRYFSGFTGGEGYLYLTKKDSFLLTDFRYTISAKEECKDLEVLQIDTGYAVLIRELMGENSGLRIGFEGNHMKYTDYKKWEKELNGFELVPLEDELTMLRSIKTEEEQNLIRQAQAIGDLVFGEMIYFIKSGMTEKEVANQIECLLKSYGADGLSFDIIAASGVNSAKPHAVPTDKRLETGDFLTMDFGCHYQGYCSDMTRTVVIGKASLKQKEIYQKVLEAQLLALDFIQAGYKGKEIDRVARDFIYKAGYEGCFGHGLGHSVGLEIHEKPALSPSENRIILPNTIETVEPGIYVGGFGGVRIEDLIVVTDNGYINFTNSTKELIEL